MRLFTLTAALLLAAHTASAAETPPAANNAGITVMLGDISDNRTTGQFFSGLKVELKISGDKVYDAYGIGKPALSAATDDTGRQLIKENTSDTLIWDMQTRQKKSNSETVTAELNNPSRKASTINLQGTLPVFVPSQDPSSVVTLPDISAVYGKPLESKQTDISITVLDKATSDARAKAKEEEQKKKAAAAGNALNMALGQMFGMGGSLRENDLQFRVKDPNHFLVRLEVVGPDGKLVETNGRSKMSSEGEDVYTNNYNNPLPKGSSLKIYYATAKSMINVPFHFENVPLP